MRNDIRSTGSVMAVIGSFTFVHVPFDEAAPCTECTLEYTEVCNAGVHAHAYEVSTHGR